MRNIGRLRLATVNVWNAGADPAALHGWSSLPTVLWLEWGALE
jgi:hypothetical protein